MTMACSTRAERNTTRSTKERPPSSSLPPPSLHELFCTHRGFVCRVLARLGVPQADIEDVAQDVFLSAHRNLPGFEGRCSLSTWLYGVCQRRAVDYRRRAYLRREICSAEPPDRGAEPNQEVELNRSDANQRLAQLLSELDAEKLAVFRLFVIEQLPMEQVAERVGCGRQTAYSRLYAARRKLDARARCVRRPRSG